MLPFPREFNLPQSLMMNSLIDISVFSFIIALYLYRRRYISDKYLPLPPGPKKLPIIGNLLDIPKNFEWVTYHKWCQELGSYYRTCAHDNIELYVQGSDIIHLDVAGTSIIILDNAKITTDLLEKRSSIYSSRSPNPVA